MGEITGIEWCDHTFNPWIGCAAVSPACAGCYAERFAKRLGVAWGPHADRRFAAETTWKLPERWNRAAEREGRRRRVFCASLADVFDNAVPGAYLLVLLDLIRRTPHLDWLLLTKRPQLILRRLRDAENDADAPAEVRWDTQPAKAWIQAWLAGEPPANVWLGATAENQTEADRRTPHLLDAPARVRFLSCEPLLGPVDLSSVCILPKVPGSHRAGIHIDALRGRYVESGLPYVGSWDIAGPCPDGSQARRIDWVIAGGESGPGARPSHPDWFRSLRDQCSGAGASFFFKQWGEWKHAPERAHFKDAYPEPWQRVDSHLPGVRPALAFRLGKKVAGSVLDGRDHRETPHA